LKLKQDPATEKTTLSPGTKKIGVAINLPPVSSGGILLFEGCTVSGSLHGSFAGAPL